MKRLTNKNVMAIVLGLLLNITSFTALVQASENVLSGAEIYALPTVIYDDQDPPALPPTPAPTMIYDDQVPPVSGDQVVTPTPTRIYDDQDPPVFPPVSGDQVVTPTSTRIYDDQDPPVFPPVSGDQVVTPTSTMIYDDQDPPVFPPVSGDQVVTPTSTMIYDDQDPPVGYSSGGGEMTADSVSGDGLRSPTAVTLNQDSAYSSNLALFALLIVTFFSATSLWFVSHRH